MPALTDDLEVLITHEGGVFEDTSGNALPIDAGGVSLSSVNPLIGEWSGIYVDDDWLGLGSALEFSASQPWTLAKWVNLADVTDFQPIIAKQLSTNQAGYMMSVSGFSNIGEVAVFMGTNLSNRILKRSSVLLSNNTTYLLMVTHDGSGTLGGLNIYINNSDGGDGGNFNFGTVTDPNYSGINLRMGARQGDEATFSVTGKMDVGAIWSRDLTDSPENRAEFYNGGAGWEGAVGVPLTSLTRTFKIDQARRALKIDQAVRTLKN